MTRWLGRWSQRSHLAAGRVLEGIREIGILFIALAPLESGRAVDTGGQWSVLRFEALGLFLFMTAVVLEWRSRDGA
jgi:hypothetical protein